MWKKIYDIAIVVALLVSVVLAGVQSYRVYSLSKSLDRYRLDLADARRANERYADTYRRATETNTELGECLSEHISTLSQLRGQIQQVKSRYDEMQKILMELEDLGSGSLDGFDIGGGDQCTMK